MEWAEPRNFSLNHGLPLAALAEDADNPNPFVKLSQFLSSGQRAKPMSLFWGQLALDIAQDLQDRPIDGVNVGAVTKSIASYGRQAGQRFTRALLSRIES